MSSEPSTSEGRESYFELIDSDVEVVEDDEDSIIEVFDEEADAIKVEPEDVRVLAEWLSQERRSPSLLDSGSYRRTPSPAISASILSSPSRGETPSTSQEPRERSRSPLSPLFSDQEVPAEEPVAIVGRGRGRGLGRGRGRGRSGRGRRGGHLGGASDDWRPGHRLQEIYVSDDDVPDDLRAMIMHVYDRRLARQAADRRRDARYGVDEDEFFDADDGGDAALFAGEEDATNFEWRPMQDYRPERETFIPQRTGPTAASKSAYAAFRQYWDDGILSRIVSETNRYAATRNLQDWYETNVHELLVLFAFWMMLGIMRMPSVKSCFSSYYLLQTRCFKLMFTRVRYERLCSSLSFNNDDLKTPNSSKLFPIEPILTHLNQKFQSAYIPRQEICIDESLTLWKGNLSFRQFIKSKAAKFGIKTFELCESATGYLWSFFVYTGKDSTYQSSLPSSLLKSTASVLTLITPLLNKGYTLFMDNWFNSPLLARFLKRNKTDVVGTLRMSRQHVPPLITHCNLQAGQFVARHSNDMMVMAYHDKKKMALISTYHGAGTAQATPKKDRAAVWKPQLVLDYNKSMGGVDMKDGMLEQYLLERKRCLKWHMKLFKRLLNCSILNSRICYEASTGKRCEHIVFRLELVDQILSHHLESVPKRHILRGPADPDQRFTTNRHWPTLIRSEPGAARTPRRRCAQCTTRRQTRFECTLCDVGLCADVCFGAYHNTRP